MSTFDGDRTGQDFKSGWITTSRDRAVSWCYLESLFPGQGLKLMRARRWVSSTLNSFLRLLQAKVKWNSTWLKLAMWWLRGGVGALQSQFCSWGDWTLEHLRNYIYLSPFPRYAVYKSAFLSCVCYHWTLVPEVHLSILSSQMSSIFFYRCHTKLKTLESDGWRWGCLGEQLIKEEIWLLKYSEGTCVTRSKCTWILIGVTVLWHKQTKVCLTKGNRSINGWLPFNSFFASNQFRLRV